MKPREEISRFLTFYASCSLLFVVHVLSSVCYDYTYSYSERFVIRLVASYLYFYSGRSTFKHLELRVYYFFNFFFDIISKLRNLTN